MTASYHAAVRLQGLARKNPGIIRGMAAWIDTHNHLDDAAFDDDRDVVVQRAHDADVAMVVVPAVGVGNFDLVRVLAHRHGLAYALGIHPMVVPGAAEADLQTLQLALLAHRDDPRLVAVGEIGIDGFVPACITPESMAKQKRFFLAQLGMARDLGLPVIVHVRKAVDDVLAGLRRVQVPGGIAHAYNGSEAQARTLVGMGLKLGFGGAMTFERALHLRRLATRLPIESIVLETDSPDIAPQWLYRTREQREGGASMRNEAAELPRIAHVLATLRGLPLPELAAAMQVNTCAALPRLSALLLQWPNQTLSLDWSNPP